MDLSARRSRNSQHPQAERGAILILSALIMILILMIAAFATDLGAWYRQGQEQQRTADLAALNAVQGYDNARAAYFDSKGASAWSDLTAAEQLEAETAAFEEAMDQIVGIMAAAGTTVSATPTYNILPPPDESSANVTADDGTVIVLTRSITNEIVVSVSAPGTQYFSNLIRSAPEIERNASAVLSNCGAECSIPIVLNPPFSGFTATGDGDGYSPLLYGTDEVWAVNHHLRNSTEGNIICMERETEAPCTPSGTFATGRFDTGNRPVEYIDEVGGKIYFAARDRNADRSGLACFDIVTRSFCSTDFVDLWDATNQSWPNTINVIGPWRNGNNLYVLAQNGQMGCVTTGMVSCGISNTASFGSGNIPALNDNAQVSHGEQIGSRVYLTQNGSGGVTFHCWDFATDSACWGGSTQYVNYLPNGGDDHLTFLRYNSGGTASGICVMDIVSLRNACVDMAGSGSTEIAAMNTHLAALSNTWGGDAFGFDNKRTFFAGGNSNHVGCWDWTVGTVGAGCGTLDLDTISASVINPYGFSQVTGECIIGLGHNSIFYSFNPYGMTACVDTLVETRIYPCLCADGGSRWGVVQIPPTLLAQVDLLEATVTEPDGTVVLADYDLIANLGWMDLSHADQTAAYLDLTLTVNSKLKLDGTPMWTEPIDAELTLVVQPTLSN